MVIVSDVDVDKEISKDNKSSGNREEGNSNG